MSPPHPFDPAALRLPLIAPFSPLPAPTAATATADDFTPDPFDPTAVELMRALSAKAKPAAHIYPFTMFSYK
jgi:hypothetical protein